MTRKSYKLIAESIKGQLDWSKSLINEDTKIIHNQTLREHTENLATILKLDNPRFDRDKFLSDCGF